MLYLPHAGVQRGRTLCVDAHCASFSPPVHCFFLRSFKTISQSQVVPPSNNPAIHKKLIRLLPRKMPGDWYPWQKSMCAGWGVRVFLCFPKSRW